MFDLLTSKNVFVFLFFFFNLRTPRRFSQALNIIDILYQTSNILSCRRTVKLYFFNLFCDNKILMNASTSENSAEVFLQENCFKRFSCRKVFSPLEDFLFRRGFFCRRSCFRKSFFTRDFSSVLLQESFYCRTESFRKNNWYVDANR